MKLLTSVFLFLLVDSAFPLEKIERKTSAAGGGRIPNSFIVQFKDVASSSSISSHFEWVDSLIGASSSQTLDGKKVGVVHKYGISAFKGYSGVFPTDIIEKIKKRSDVYHTPSAIPSLLLTHNR
jgi:hypothetical protein